MRRAAPVLLLLMLIQGGLADDDGWNFTPSKGARTKEDAQLLTLAASFDGQEDDPRLPSWWASFKETFYKTYPDAAAEATAFANFKANLGKIFGINSDLTLPFWTTGNFYADYDYETFRQIFLMTNLNLTQLNQGRRLREKAAIPESEIHARRKLLGTSVDWRNSGKLTPVKDQGSCGSCWAYSATAAIEAAYNMNQGLSAQLSKIDLSEQQLIDCVGSSSSCNGGSSDNAIRYVNSVYQEVESLYPATFQDGGCQAGGSAPTGSAVRLAGPTQYPGTYSESTLMQAVSNQPTVIYFEVANDFYSYAGGTYVASSCGTAVNHAMVVVGYYYSGDSSSSYWIVRNSWGAYWGDNGYIYVQMTGTSEGPCGMYQYAFQPPAQFSLTLSNNNPAPSRPGTPNSPWAPGTPRASPPPYRQSPPPYHQSPPPYRQSPPPSAPGAPDSPDSPQPAGIPNSPWAPWTPTPWSPWAPWAPWAPSAGSDLPPTEAEPPAPHAKSPSPPLDHHRSPARPPRPQHTRSPRVPRPPRTPSHPRRTAPPRRGAN